MRASMDGGKMHRSMKPSQTRAVVHGAISFHYVHPRVKKIGLSPYMGLSNTLIFPWDEKPVVSTEVFSPSENEFGVVVGVEPFWKHARYLISIPVQLDHVFSHPRPFTTFGGGLQFGRSF